MWLSRILPRWDRSCLNIINPWRCVQITAIPRTVAGFQERDHWNQQHIALIGTWRIWWPTVTRLEKSLFDSSLCLKETSCSGTTPTSPTDSDPNRVKLLKLDVLQFSRNIILHQTRFGEQFCISLHERPSLSNTEKYIYLQQALRGGSARSSIEGLS